MENQECTDEPKHYRSIIYARHFGERSALSPRLTSLRGLTLASSPPAADCDQSAHVSANLTRPLK